MPTTALKTLFSHSAVPGRFKEDRSLCYSLRCKQLREGQISVILRDTEAGGGGSKSPPPPNPPPSPTGKIIQALLGFS